MMLSSCLTSAEHSVYAAGHGYSVSSPNKEHSGMRFDFEEGCAATVSHKSQRRQCEQDFGRQRDGSTAREGRKGQTNSGRTRAWQSWPWCTIVVNSASEDRYNRIIFHI